VKKDGKGRSRILGSLEVLRYGIMKDSSRARELFKHSTVQGLYPKSFVAFMNGLIGGVEGASAQ
jgi:hypothetical protein